MSDPLILYYSQFFESQQGFSLLNPFSKDGETKCYEAEIEVITQKGPLLFFVSIPESYPYGDAKFYCKSINGYPHQNLNYNQELGGFLCLSTPFVNDRKFKLELEIKQLQLWIERYYVKEEEDNHYEYPAFHASQITTLLFEEESFKDEQSRFDNNSFGRFSFTPINYEFDKNRQLIHMTALAMNLGNRESCSWSEYFKKKEKKFGFWVFIEKEPIRQKKEKFENWEELIPLLPLGFEKGFRNFAKSIGNIHLGPKKRNQHILLAVGYYIPNGKNDKEVHWDLIMFPIGQLGKKVFNRFSFNLMKGPIPWDNTQNCSYPRFFGRGKFCDKITSAKILIIGIGAIGSSVAETLVKGGCKNISLSDIDIVEHGNICRSMYSFMDVNQSKIQSLRSILQQISPFTEIELIDSPKPSLPNSEQYNPTINSLKKFDYIFDCSTDNEILQFLSSINLGNTTICNIGITNKAEELLFTTSDDTPHVMSFRNEVLRQLNKIYEIPIFREGTGCWSPTFEAAFFDIQALVNFSLKQWNQAIFTKNRGSSFWINSREEQLQINRMIKFYQEDLDLHLAISSTCLEKIKKSAKEYFPNEYGGILVGKYSENNKELFILDTILPRTFRSSPIRFSADHREQNFHLIKLAYETKKEKDYVGEWHSHPKGTTDYSSIDYHAMVTVAKAETVLINNPVLLIVALNSKHEFDLGFYVYYQEYLLRYS